MALQEITKVLEIKPWLATAGMPTVDQLETVTTHSFKTIINLAMENSPGVTKNEEQIVKSFGLKYFHIPVVWEKPLRSDFDHFVSIMQSLKGEKTFIHCVLNIRVSIFVYLYRVHYLQEVKELASISTSLTIEGSSSGTNNCFDNVSNLPASSW